MPAEEAPGPAREGQEPGQRPEVAPVVLMLIALFALLITMTWLSRTLAFPEPPVGWIRMPPPVAQSLQSAGSDASEVAAPDVDAADGSDGDAPG